MHDIARIHRELFDSDAFRSIAVVVSDRDSSHVNRAIIANRRRVVGSRFTPKPKVTCVITHEFISYLTTDTHELTEGRTRRGLFRDRYTRLVVLEARSLVCCEVLRVGAETALLRL